MATTVGELSVLLGADIGNLQRGLAQAGRDLERFAGEGESRLSRLSGGLTQAGQAMTIGLTVPLVGVGVAAANAAIDFESAFAGVVKTVDATDAQLADLRATILDMATDASNPVSGLENAPIVLSQIGEAAGQLGIATDYIDEFIQTTAMLDMSTNLTADSAATMGAQFANITQMDMAFYDEFGSTLVALGNAGASTESDIMEMGLRIAAAGEQAGWTEAQILGLASAAASLGINAEAGGTAATRVLNTLTTALASYSETTVSAASMQASAEGQLADAMRERDRAARNLASAQDRLNRSHTVSGTNSAINSIEDWTPKLEEAQAAVDRLSGRLEGMAGTGSVTFSNASEELQLFARTAGMTVDEFVQKAGTDMPAALNAFMAGLGELGAAAQLDVLGALGMDDIRVADFMRRFANNPELLAEQLQIASDAWGENTALMTEAEKRAATTAAQLNTLKNNVQAAGIALGGVFLAAINKAVGAAIPFLQGISKANPEVLKLAVGIGLAVAAVGPLTMALGALLTPIGLVAGAMAGLALAFEMNLGGIRDAVNAAVDGILGDVGGIGSIVDDLLAALFPPDFDASLYEGIADSAVTFQPTDLLKIEIKEGDTLWDIWFSNFKDQWSFDEFLNQIGMDGTETIHPGDILTIPGNFGAQMLSLFDAAKLGPGELVRHLFGGGTVKLPTISELAGQSAEADYASTFAARGDVAQDIFENELLPALQGVLTRARDWFDEQAGIGLDWLGSLFKGTVDTGGETPLYTAFSKMLDGDLTGAINAVVPGLGDKLAKALVGVDFNFEKEFPRITAGLDTLLTNVGAWLVNEGIPTLTRAAGNLSGHIALALHQALTAAVDWLGGGGASSAAGGLVAGVQRLIADPFQQGFADAVGGTELDGAALSGLGPAVAAAVVAALALGLAPALTAAGIGGVVSGALSKALAASSLVISGASWTVSFAAGAAASLTTAAGQALYAVMIGQGASLLVKVPVLSAVVSAAKYVIAFGVAESAGLLFGMLRSSFGAAITTALTDLKVFGSGFVYLAQSALNVAVSVGKWAFTIVDAAAGGALSYLTTALTGWLTATFGGTAAAVSGAIATVGIGTIGVVAGAVLALAGAFAWATDYDLRASVGTWLSENMGVDPVALAISIGVDVKDISFAAAIDEEVELLQSGDLTGLLNFLITGNDATPSVPLPVDVSVLPHLAPPDTGQMPDAEPGSLFTLPDYTDYDASGNVRNGKRRPGGGPDRAGNNAIVLDIAVDPRLTIDTEGVTAQIQTALDTAALNEFPEIVWIAPTLMADIGALTEQVDQLLQDALAIPFRETAVLDLTLLPGKINIDAVRVAVQGKLNSLAPGGGGASGPTIPAFATGGIMPYTGLAYLHAGERVLTRGETANGARGVVNNYYISAADLLDGYAVVDALQRTESQRGGGV